MGLFLPEYRFQKLSEITPAFLTSQGVRFLFMDIDNTVEPYENPRPTEGALAWFSEMESAGVGVVFISNNKEERVALFNERLGYPYYARAGKPFPRFIKRAMREIGAGKEDSLFIGDQIFTDVLGGHLAGMKAALLPPIKDKTDLFTRAKRRLEKPILKRTEKNR